MTITRVATGRADAMYGRGLDALFPVVSRRADGTPERAPITLVPWASAGRRIDEPLYDEKLVEDAVRGQQMTEVDPRDLYAIQPNLTLAGVKYYLGEQYEQTGEPFADKDKSANRYPVIYLRRRNNQHVILTGHHRAAAALLKGEDLRCILVKEPEDYGQHTGHHAAVPRRPAFAVRRDPGDLGRGGRGGDPSREDRRAARGRVGRGGEDAGDLHHPVRAHAAVRQDGLSALAQSYGEDVILRGLKWTLPDGPKGWALAQRILHHTITAQEIVHELEPLGVWWGLTSQYGWLADYEDHAWGEDTIPKMIADAEEEAADRGESVVERWFGAHVPVVLVAKRPTVMVEGKPEPWDPEYHNPSNGLMGNSYVPDHQPLEVIEVRYSIDGDTWTSLSVPQGIRTTANRLGDVAQAAKDAIDIALDKWRPTKGMYAYGKDTLDPRIFDLTTQQMRADVRAYVLSSLDACWTPMFGRWQDWAKVYLAGSGASYWWDSDSDLDMMVGVDLDALRRDRPANVEVPDEDIYAHLNKTLMDLRPSMAAYQPDPGDRPMSVTYFVNPGAYDVTTIHPYAAYDVTENHWVVKPPVLPKDWGPEMIPDSTWRRCEQVAREARYTLSLPEPERTIEGIKLFDWVHEGRRAAYSAYGGGWLDPGQVTYQYLEQTPDHLLRRLFICKHPEQATAAEAVEKVASARDGDTGVHAMRREEADQSFLEGSARERGTRPSMQGVQARQAQEDRHSRADRDEGLQGLRRREASSGVPRSGVSIMSGGMASGVWPENSHPREGSQGLSEEDVRPHSGAVRRDAGEAGRSLRDVSENEGRSGWALAQRGSLPHDGSHQGSSVRPMQHVGGTSRGRPGGGLEVGSGHGAVLAGSLKHPEEKTAAEALEKTAVWDIPRGIGMSGTGYWDKSGDEPVWHQPHEELVAAALSQWKGHPVDVMRWVNYIESGENHEATNGTAKIDRARAQALLEEFTKSAKANPKPLYRGDTRSPGRYSAWSERRAVAQRWGEGKVWTIPAGQARGLMIADYITSGLDADEKEWIVQNAPDVSVAGKTAAAGRYDKVERTVTLDGIEFRLEFDPLRSPWWRTIGAYAGPIEAGYLTWGFDNKIGDVGVQKRYQRKGLATEMLKFAREIVPDLQHSHALTPDGKAWSEKVGAQKAAMGYDLDQDGDEDVIGPLGQRWNGYSPLTRQRITNVVEDVQAGRRKPEPKQRELSGYYSVDLDGRSEPERLLFAPVKGQWDAVMFLKQHQYAEAERVLPGWQQSADFRKYFGSKTAGLLDTLPKPMGQTPVPPGTIRCFHYTPESNAESIARSGLLERYARGDGNMGAGNEASAGVWASTGKSAGSGGMDGPGPGQAVVEFWIKPDQVSQRAEYPWNGEDLVSWGNGGYHHIIVNGDVLPNQIVAIHLPWHDHARYMQQQPGSIPTPEVAEGLPQEYKQAYDYVIRHRTGRRTASEDYWGGHRPPADGPTLDNLLGEGTWFPDDVYDHPEYYAHTGGGEPWEKETFRVIKAVRGKPNAMVSIYRALPPGHTSISAGDWVALSEGYCRQHAAQDDDPAHDWPVIKAEVPAHTVRNGGNDVIEWGYYGGPINGRIAKANGHLPGGIPAKVANRTLYHGTDETFAPGTVLSTVDRSNYQQGIYQGRGVYLTDDPAMAFFYAVFGAFSAGRFEGTPHVYEVTAPEVKYNQPGEFLSPSATVMTDATQHAASEFAKHWPDWKQMIIDTPSPGFPTTAMILVEFESRLKRLGLTVQAAEQPQQPEQEPKDIRLVLIHKTDPEKAYRHLQQHLDTIPAEDKTGAVYPVQRKTVGEWDKSLMHSLTKTHGFSLHDHVGDAPTKGFMVSVDRDGTETMPLMDTTPQRISDYMSIHQQELKDPNNYLGGWVHKGQTYLDISRWVPDQEQATKLAKANKQLGIYDLSSGQTVMTAA